MSRDPSDVDEEAQIYIDLGQHGWSDLIIVSNGKVLLFGVSDVFTDMSATALRLCDAVLENIHLRVALCDEPGGVVLEVKPDTKQKHIMTLSIFQVDGPKSGFDADETGETVFEGRIKRRRLVGMLMSELWKTHMFLREPSYQKARDHFPHAELVKANKAWDESPLGPSFLK